eukprot:gene15215-15359_t
MHRLTRISLGTEPFQRLRIEDGMSQSENWLITYFGFNQGSCGLAHLPLLLNPWHGLNGIYVGVGGKFAPVFAIESSKICAVVWDLNLRPSGYEPDE